MADGADSISNGTIFRWVFEGIAVVGSILWGLVQWFAARSVKANDKRLDDLEARDEELAAEDKKLEEALAAQREKLLLEWREIARDIRGEVVAGMASMRTSTDAINGQLAELRSENRLQNNEASHLAGTVEKIDERLNKVADNYKALTDELRGKLEDLRRELELVRRTKVGQ